MNSDPNGASLTVVVHRLVLTGSVMEEARAGKWSVCANTYIKFSPHSRAWRSTGLNFLAVSWRRRGVCRGVRQLVGLGTKKPTTYRKQNWFHSGHHVIVSKKLYHILKKINVKRPPPRPKRQEGVSAAWVEIDLLDLVPTPLKTGSARLRAAGCSFDWEHVVQLKSGSSAAEALRSALSASDDRRASSYNDRILHAHTPVK